MNRSLTISVITLIAAVMVIGVISPAMAKEGNNGNNGCEKSNPNSKACEKNPNTTAETCESCFAKYEEQRIACEGNFECLTAAHEALVICVNSIPEEDGTCEVPTIPTP